MVVLVSAAEGEAEIVSAESELIQFFLQLLDGHIVAGKIDRISTATTNQRQRSNGVHRVVAFQSSHVTSEAAASLGKPKGRAPDHWPCLRRLNRAPWRAAVFGEPRSTPIGFQRPPGEGQFVGLDQAKVPVPARTN